MAASHAYPTTSLGAEFVDDLADLDAGEGCLGDEGGNLDCALLAGAVDQVVAAQESRTGVGEEPGAGLSDAVAHPHGDGVGREGQRLRANELARLGQCLLELLVA